MQIKLTKPTTIAKPKQLYKGDGRTGIVDWPEPIARIAIKQFGAIEVKEEKQTKAAPAKGKKPKG